MHGHIHPAQVLFFVSGLGGGKQLLGLRCIFRPGAEHTGALFALIVPVGEAAAGKGIVQLLLFGLGGLAVLVHQPAVDGGDDGHVFRPFHAAFQLQAGHAHVSHLLQIGREIGILQAERIGVSGGGVNAVRQTAGLCAAAAVAASCADKGAHGTLAGIAHAQSAVGKSLHLGAAATADLGDLGAGQLTGKDHTLHTQIGGLLCAAQTHQAHLGTGVDRQIRRHLPGQSENAPVLYQNGIHAAAAGKAQQLRCIFQLPVAQQRVEGQIDFGSPQMAILHRRQKVFGCEVLGAASGIEGAYAQINGVGPVLYCRHHGFPGAGRGKDLGFHLRFCARKSCRFSSEASALACVASSR